MGPSYEQVDPKWFGPFGETHNDWEGGRLGVVSQGVNQRKYVWDQAEARRGQADANRRFITDKIYEAANSPALPEVLGLMRRQLRGDYLSGSPELRERLAQITAAGERAGADEEAAARDGLARAGMRFSTPMQQAQQAARAARRAQARDTATGEGWQDYRAERMIQQQAPTSVFAALSEPLNNTGQLNPALYNDLDSELTLLMKGINGGTMQNPQLIQKPGAMDMAQQALSMASSVAGMAMM
ncbi:MAG: hypothetical protein LBK60_01495 [Verrucomicrobiales bacterium]|jgi:hypothetical protein|nr:hypothetical protein [Verrucomicrobiales bacterium]